MFANAGWRKFVPLGDHRRTFDQIFKTSTLKDCFLPSRKALPLFSRPEALLSLNARSLASMGMGKRFSFRALPQTAGGPFLCAILGTTDLKGSKDSRLKNRDQFYRRRTTEGTIEVCFFETKSSFRNSCAQMAGQSRSAPGGGEPDEIAKVCRCFSGLRKKQKTDSSFVAGAELVVDGRKWSQLTLRACPIYRNRKKGFPPAQ